MELGKFTRATNALSTASDRNDLVVAQNQNSSVFLRSTRRFHLQWIAKLLFSPAFAVALRTEPAKPRFDRRHLNRGRTRPCSAVAGGCAAKRPCRHLPLGNCMRWDALRPNSVDLRSQSADAGKFAGDACRPRSVSRAEFGAATRRNLSERVSVEADHRPNPARCVLTVAIAEQQEMWVRGLLAVTRSLFWKTRG